MHDLLAGISLAKEEEIGALLEAVLQRYAELFPEWEIMTVSLERSKDRKVQLERIIEVLQKAASIP